MAKKLTIDAKGVAYVTHPTTPAVKAHLNAQGFRVVDAQFAPEGAEIIDSAALEAELSGEPEGSDKLPEGAGSEEPAPARAPAQKAVKGGAKPAAK